MFTLISPLGSPKAVKNLKMSNNWYNIVSSFVKSSSNLRIVSLRVADSAVFSASKTATTATNAGEKHNILILDSSFNPPHKGHVSIIENAINYYSNKTQASTSAPATTAATVVLMLSVNNADKLHPKPELFDKRLQLIDLLSDYLYKINKQKVSVLICLTKFAKFTDKYHEFKQLLLLLNNNKISNEDTTPAAAQQQEKDANGEESSDWIKLQSGNNELLNYNIAFLVGFDTIVRIFDAKYYHPNSIEESLQEFIAGSDLLCLARNTSNGNSNDLSEQESYAKNIKDGKILGVPAAWSSKIIVLNPTKGEDSSLGKFITNVTATEKQPTQCNDKETEELLRFLTTISSSEIRNKLEKYFGDEKKSASGKDKEDIDEFLQKRTIKEIADHILQHEFYNN